MHTQPIPGKHSMDSQAPGITCVERRKEQRRKLGGLPGYMEAIEPNPFSSRNGDDRRKHQRQIG